MNWLEKMGLVECEDEPVTTDIPVEPQASIPTSTVEVDAEINSASNIVSDIYAQNNLSDKSDSIYAVQEYIATLPTEMPTATKQKTVAGILMVSKKPVADLVSDALNRMEVLRAARDKVVGEYTDEIDSAKADIETMKQAIEAANIKIKQDQDIITATNKSIDEEIKIMNELVEFCKGMGG